MTRSATFEVTTLADAVNKAGRVAPTKGAAYDRAAGIVIDVDPSRAEQVLVMSTDLEVTFRMVVNALELGDEAVVWRVPSKLITGLMASLPMNSGAKIDLLDTGDGNLYLKCGKTKGKLRLIVGGYPVIPEFDPFGMVAAPGLSVRLAQVAWATDKRGTGILSGVHIDGTNLYGCNRASVAWVPCPVPIEVPVTAPLTEVSSIIKNTGEVNIRATESKLQVMPDPYIQATCTLFEGAYPDVPALVDRMTPKLVREFDLPVEPVLSMIERTMVLMRDERLPSTNLEIGDSYFKMTMSTDSGLIMDELDVVGGHHGEPLKVSFSPDALRSTLQASGRPTVHVRYGEKVADPFLFSDDADYQSLMMPMVKP